MTGTQKTITGSILNSCPSCNKTFKTKAALISHNNSKQHLINTNSLSEKNSEKCDKCGETFLLSGFDTHFAHCRGRQFKTVAGLELNKKREKLNETLKDPESFNDLYRMKVIGDIKLAPITINNYIDTFKEEIIKSMKTVMDEFQFVKFQITLGMTYTRQEYINMLDVEVEAGFSHLFGKPNFDYVLEDVIERLETKHEKREDELGESDLVLYSMDNIEIEYWQINPFKVKSYIPLPFISKQIINVQNKDNKCFMWAILSALHPQKDHAYRVSRYEPFVNEIPVEYQEMSITEIHKKVPKFEKLNNLRINIYQLVDNNTKKIVPLYISKSSLEKCIHLLVINADSNADSDADSNADSDADSNEEERYHYVWIKNFQKFTKEQFSNSNNEKDSFTCERCFLHTTSKNMEDKHRRLCEKSEPALMKMPHEDKAKFAFKNYSKLIKPLAIIYGDFEAINNKVDRQFGQQHRRC